MIESEISKTLFSEMLKEYGGVLRLIRSWPFLLAIVLGVISASIASNERFYDFLPAMFGASVALLTMVLASIAILAAVTNPLLLVVLYKHELLRRILFTFWLVAGVLVVSIIMESLSILRGDCSLFRIFFEGWVWRFIVLLVFFYGVLGTFCLVPTVIRFVFYRAKVESDQKEEDNV